MICKNIFISHAYQHLACESPPFILKVMLLQNAFQVSFTQKQPMFKRKTAPNWNEIIGIKKKNGTPVFGQIFYQGKDPNTSFARQAGKYKLSWKQDVFKLYQE